MRPSRMQMYDQPRYVVAEGSAAWKLVGGAIVVAVLAVKVLAIAGVV
jgi:hypothetical protein